MFDYIKQSVLSLTILILNDRAPKLSYFFAELYHLVSEFYFIIGMYIFIESRVMLCQRLRQLIMICWGLRVY
jgi:hypothetical protein